MANNIVSRWLRQDLYAPDSGDEALASYYAAKLDRLVEAAEATIETANTEVHASNAPTTCLRLDELAAALAAIKLPEGNQQ